VYGDNDQHWGRLGQALIRDEPNAAGITVKKRPSRAQDAYYTDADFADNCKRIDACLTAILARAASYDKVMWPAQLATGLAALDRKAPKTYAYLIGEVYRLFSVQYEKKK
jgi:hypothetical protein